MKRRHIEEGFVKLLMFLSVALVAGSLGFILFTVLVKGLPALNWAMLSQTPKGGYYLGKEGGILNAIIGSLYLAGGATLLALVFSLPIALYLQTYAHRSRWADIVRLSLDVLWGIPSIVYGAFGFTLMLSMGMRAVSVWWDFDPGAAGTPNHDPCHGRGDSHDAIRPGSGCLCPGFDPPGSRMACGNTPDAAGHPDGYLVGFWPWDR